MRQLTPPYIGVIALVSRIGPVLRTWSFFTASLLPLALAQTGAPTALAVRPTQARRIARQAHVACRASPGRTAGEGRPE